MAVLPVVFLDAGICSRVFRVFFQIVQFGVRYYAGGGHSVTHMVGKRYAVITIVAAVNFPGASVFSCEKVLVRAFGLR